MTFSVEQTHQQLTVRTPEVELGFSRDDGGLRLLRRAGGPNLAGHGDSRPSVDVWVGGKGWLAARVFVRYLSHSVREHAGGVEATVVIGIGPLKVYDRYHITGTLITRRVAVENVGEDELQLRGVRLGLPWLRVAARGEGWFDAPGNSVRPRVPLAVAAELRPGVPPRRFFAPGLRDERALEPAPTIAPGLMALHDDSESLLCWYHSAAEPAQPLVEGNGRALHLTHEVQLAAWLRAEATATADAQYILLLPHPWPPALAAFRRTRELTAAAPPAAGWVRDAAIYEVHPARFGGFAGLAGELPRLAALGINTLCLLPIWRFGAPAGQPWDASWDGVSPYALHSLDGPDPALGPPDELRRLVEEAHGHGMRVLLDLPLAGVATGSPLIEQQPTWFCQDEIGRPARIADAGGVIGFDWARSGLQEALVGMALGLLHEHGLDGFRVSPPRAGQPNWARGLPYSAGASALGFLRLLERLRGELRHVRPDAAIVGELGGPALGLLQDAAMDELPHHMLFHFGLDRMTAAEIGLWLADHWSMLPAGAARICFTESHHTRILNPLADGLRGSRISRMLLAGMVLCGFVPLIWSGQEEGEEPFITALLAARAASDALRYGDVLPGAVRCSSPQVLTVLRTSGGDAVVGLLNAGPHRLVVTLDLAGHAEGPSVVVDLLGGRPLADAGAAWSPADLGALRLTLEPYGAYCLAVRPAPAAPEPAPLPERLPEPVEG